MRFASIATVIRDPSNDTAPLKYAMSLAAKMNSNLSVINAPSHAVDPRVFYTGTHAIAVETQLEVVAPLRDDSEAILRKTLANHTTGWDIDTFTFFGAGLNELVAQKLRFQDLIVLALPYGMDRDSVDVTSFEACLFAARTPVLLVPPGFDKMTPPETIVVAWDNSDQALAAARAALPLIVDASRNYIYIIEPPYHGVDRSDPGGRLAEVFARVGAEVDITVAARQGPNTAEQILQQAQRVNADLIVMGGYGHSRLREAVLGGVTRTMLREAPLPILLAR